MRDRVHDETALRAAFERGDRDAAATQAVEAYGDEILRFLAAYLRSESDAQDVFGEFCEQLWEGLPGFEWRCTLRAWAYTLARHAAIDWKTAAHRKPDRNLSLGRGGAFARVADSVRARTAAYLRTETKQRMRELREHLPLDDQALIILRVDRDLSWREIAEVLSDGGARGSASDASKEEARLRKRFQLAKDRLRELARQEGLLGEE